MNDTDPLAQFQEWYDKAAGATVESRYVLARAAFFAGFAARPAEPVEPSRDALTHAPRPLARYGQPEQQDVLRQYAPGMYRRFPQRTPVPDEMRRIEPVAGPSRETLTRIHDKLRAEGVVDYPAPGRADDTNPGFPPITRADTALMPSMEHVATIWDGEMAPVEGLGDFADDIWASWGASGPVHTAHELEDGDRG